MTIAAVLLGALTTYATNQLAERSKRREARRVRWDEKKFDAYADYISKVRATISANVVLYEVREGIRTMPRSEQDLRLDLTEAGRVQAIAFERVMLLAGDAVIEAAHTVQEAMAACGWQAQGTVEGTLDKWRELHSATFRAINHFHEQARVDLGVSGRFEGEQHSARGLLIPASRNAEASTSNPQSVDHG
ncbi:hypothetical protein SNA_27815 [Streptomyces natalensis ATCC 27448]|uniref:Secreted protein n=1 Tax=Streptomyces natalensis ATCC 27448 TaxID=1240678 RepID=A0A0D7CGP1_9ACTN|nr:hypothetical protein SNA_27815 [Streptomyces natalensis ATCC 27448]